MQSSTFSFLLATATFLLNFNDKLKQYIIQNQYLPNSPSSCWMASKACSIMALVLSSSTFFFYVMIYRQSDRFAYLICTKLIKLDYGSIFKLKFKLAFAETYALDFADTVSCESPRKAIHQWKRRIGCSCSLCWLEQTIRSGHGSSGLNSFERSVAIQLVSCSLLEI